jgi:AcrR family transcriptional regulator
VARRGRPPAGGPDTREAILVAARELFAERGYDPTTMRAVAGRAGVDPALIHHYFGTKDGLLEQAITLPADPAQVLAGVSEDPRHLGEQVVRRVLTAWDDPEAQTRLVALLRIAMSHERGAELLRDLITRTVLHVVQGYTADDRPLLRASLAASQLGGLAIGRYLLKVPALADAEVDELAALVGPTIQRYLTDPLDPPL